MAKFSKIDYMWYFKFNWHGPGPDFLKWTHHIQKRDVKTRCECCHSHVVVHNGFKLRKIRSVNIVTKQSVLLVKVRRLKCKTCGTDVYEDLHFVTGKQRYTHRLARLVMELLHKMTIKDEWVMCENSNRMEKKEISYIPSFIKIFIWAWFRSNHSLYHHWN